jgi:hypothetical protein
MQGLDRTLVTEGYPTEPGLHLLWSDHNGWPVIAIVRVQVGDNRAVTWWQGVGGTDRWQGLPKMFRFAYDKYLGGSRCSPAAFAHYEALWARTSDEVKAMLAKARL